MKQEIQKEIVQSIIDANSKKFIEISEKNNINMSADNQFLITFLYDYVKTEYSILTIDKMEEMKNILEFILTHKTFNPEQELEENKSGFDIIKTIIVSLLMMVRLDNHMQNYNSDKLSAPILIIITALISHNEKMKELLDLFMKSDKAIEEVRKDKNYMTELYAALIQTNNQAGMQILETKIKGKAELIPMELMHTSILYSNEIVLENFIEEFNKYATEVPEDTIYHLLEAAVYNKRKNERILNIINETKPIQYFIENYFKDKKYDLNRERFNKEIENRFSNSTIRY